MSSKQFVHLHLHTQYSLLDGVNKISSVIEQAKAMGQPAIAITDHGNLHGAIEFYETAKKVGIKPLIGCELYVTPGSRFERKARAQGGAGTHHLTVIAKDLEGYRNLCRLTSLAYQEGFYFKPRVDHELLQRYHKGLIVLSGCLAGELAHFAEIEDEKAAVSLVEFYSKLFGENYYLEVQPHAIREQQKLNQVCFDVAKRLGVPLVATTDCHYGTADDHFAQEVLMCISTGKQITDPDRIRHEGVKLHLKTAEEMQQEFSGWTQAEEAIANSLRIAEQCSLDFDFSKHFMPQFPEDSGKTLAQMMAEQAREGLQARVATLKLLDPSWSAEKEQQYERRLELEIALIDKMGFCGYFLVVSDFIVWAKERGIPVGPGRGSCAGSLVAYAMRITEIDPISNKLLFERFLNPDRVSLPDIDVDFCIFGRDQVIKYVVEKYGKDRVAQIATFGTLKAKAAIKDVGRALGKSYAEMDRVAQLVPAPRQGFDVPLAEALEQEPRLKEYAEGEGRDHIKLCLKLEGLTRHSSTHAAGVVIGDRPLIDLLPMMLDKDENDVTQYSMKYVEKVGLVKFDFLGLKTLTVIHTALAIIKESRGETIDLGLLPLNDPATYQLLCAGDTTGIFQLESGGITDMTVRLKPNCFDDLVAILALYRPGPLDAGMVDHYIARKHGREKVSYMHPLMEGVLSDTYGIMIYQEQIMQLARDLAGYSLGEADLLRRAMGKKNPEEMAKQRDRFVSGAAQKQISGKLANEIFDQMETFARYGFNRSHSAAYAMISFQTAYLKSHYGVEFMAALMSHEIDDTDKVLKNFNDCRKQKIVVLPPDVNSSLAGFSVDAGKIRYGLSAVKGIGEKAVESIAEARKTGGAFVDLEDLVARVDLQSVNKRVLENLIKCGGFDFTGLSRRELFERLEDVHKAGQSLQRDKNTNQISLFGGAQQKPTIARRQSARPEWPVNQKLAYEREALGFYISGHPLSKHQRAIERMGVLSTIDLRNKKTKTEVRVGGVVTGLKLKNTKKGDRYATFVLEDWQGTVEAIIWPDTYQKVAHVIVADDPVIVSGRLDVSDERCTLIVSDIESLIELRDRRATKGILNLNEADDISAMYPKLREIFDRHRGNIPVRVHFEIEGQPVAPVLLKNEGGHPVCVKPSENLCDEIEELFRKPVLSFMV